MNQTQTLEQKADLTECEPRREAKSLYEGLDLHERAQLNKELRYAKARSYGIRVCGLRVYHY